MALQINLEGKVALITGVSSGIGAGIAKMFAMAGANVSGCGTSANGSEFLKEAEKRQAKAMYTSIDVTVEEDLVRLVKQTIAKFGRIDFLISNAGKNVFEGAADCGPQQWEKNIELNLASHWRLARLCKPYLEQNKGVIIIMSSNHAFSSIAGCFPYSVAKTALTGLVRSLAIEWSPLIRTVGIAPGFIETSGSKKWFESFPDPELEEKSHHR